VERPPKPTDGRFNATGLAVRLLLRAEHTQPIDAKDRTDEKSTKAKDGPRL